MKLTLLACVAASCILSTAASAAVLGSSNTLDFSASPTTFSFGAAKEASFTLSYVNQGFFDYNPDGITTGGTGRVASLGAPFYDPAAPTAYGSGGLIDGSVAQFLPYSSPAIVPYSLSDEFIGLSFTLADGVHYGYAEVAGPSLLRYAYETIPGAGIITGAEISGSIGAVPEPGTWLTMFAGFGLVGFAIRHQRRSSRELRAPLTS